MKCVAVPINQLIIQRGPLMNRLANIFSTQVIIFIPKELSVERVTRTKTRKKAWVYTHGFCKKKKVFRNTVVMLLIKVFIS